MDYRRLNGASTTDAYPMPQVDKLINRLSKDKSISTINLTWRFWQVPLAMEAREKGLSLCYLGCREQMQRGLDDFAGTYIDDLMVFSNTWEEHIQHLCIMFQRIKEVGLTARAIKCHFGESHCVYLGQRIGGGIVCPAEAKIEAIR